MRCKKQKHLDCTPCKPKSSSIDALGYDHSVPSPDVSPTRRKHSGPLSWVGDTFRNRGFIPAIRYYAVGAFEFLRDLLPARRKSRFGDIDYDFEHGVDTTWATVSLRTRLREWLSGGQYQPSEPVLFQQILHSLPVPLDGFTFIDLGSGKGRTLLLASEYPFRRIIGAELLPELNKIALSNIARFQDAKQKCFDIESSSLDARVFQFPVEPIVLYLFNPFPEHVLRAVLANLYNSQLATPRATYVVYHNLVHESVFLEQSWLREISKTHQYAVYLALP